MSNVNTLQFGARDLFWEMGLMGADELLYVRFDG